MALGDLGRRVAVAGVGIPAVLGALALGGWVLGGAGAVLAALGAREVAHLHEARGGRPLKALAMMGAAGMVLAATAFPSAESLALWVFSGVFALVFVGLTVAMPLRGVDGGALAGVSVSVFATVYVGTPLAFLVLLHAQADALGWNATGPFSGWAVLLPLAAVWIGDSAAYFAGSRWGKARIAPSISPKKSWVGGVAGALGSAAGAVLWLALGRTLFDPGPSFGFAAAAGVGAVLGILGQVGDFAESLLKREAGVKDSGAVFPGHGGVLDRLDALVPALPAAYLILRFLEVGP